MPVIPRCTRREITKDMRRTVFKMAFAGYNQKDICLILGFSVDTFHVKRHHDAALDRAYRAGIHYYLEWVKLKRYENRIYNTPNAPKIRGTNIGLIPGFFTKKTLNEIMRIPYIPSPN